MSKLRFEFNPQKLVQALVFFSKSGIDDLTKMKIHKLLFFTDKRHLLRHGRPIVGDEYFALRFGPVLSRVDNILDAAEEVLVTSGATETEREFGGFLRMQPGGPYPVVKAVGPENYGVFSKSDLTVLAEVAREYGAMTASALSKLAHEDPAYAISDRDRLEYGRAEMPYELFFEGEEDKTMLEVAMAEQEDRDLMATLG